MEQHNNDETKSTSKSAGDIANKKSASSKKKRSKYFDYDENGRKKRKKVKKLHYNLGWIIFIIFLIFLASFFLYMKETMGDDNFLQNWYNEHPDDRSSSSQSEEISEEDSSGIDIELSSESARESESAASAE